jgi:hypothetical protein
VSLEDWSRNGWLIPHETGPEEIGNLLDIANRDLHDCGVEDLSNDWRLNIAYNAALQLATAALAAAGFRSTRERHHYLTIQSLAHTIGADAKVIQSLERFRKKRNVGGYEQAGIASDIEVKEMVSLAGKLRATVEDWIRRTRPELFP